MSIVLSDDMPAKFLADSHVSVVPLGVGLGIPTSFGEVGVSDLRSVLLGDVECVHVVLSFVFRLGVIASSVIYDSVSLEKVK